MKKDFFKIGSHNVICDVCGKKRKKEQIKKRWDGVMACTVENCWEPKPPYYLPRRIVVDNRPVWDARPRLTGDQWVYATTSGLTTWEDNGLRWDTLNWNWEDIPWYRAYITIGT